MKVSALALLVACSSASLGVVEAFQPRLNHRKASSSLSSIIGSTAGSPTTTRLHVAASKNIEDSLASSIEDLAYYNEFGLTNPPISLFGKGIFLWVQHLVFSQLSSYPYPTDISRELL